MANRDLVAIGTSAGAVEALSFLCKALPAQFPATILITHRLNRSMPDHVVCLADLPLLLNSLVQRPARDPKPVPESVRFEVGIASGHKASMRDMDRIAAVRC